MRRDLRIKALAALAAGLATVGLAYGCRPVPEATAAPAEESDAAARAAIFQARDTFANRDGKALRTGLRFLPAVPVRFRATLVEDLAWLGGLGRLDGSEAWAPALGIGRSATGPDLLAWVLRNVRVLDGAGPCTLKGHVVVSNLNPEFPGSLYRAPALCSFHDQNEHKGFLGLAPASSFAASRDLGEADGMVVDGNVVLFDRGAPRPNLVILSDANLSGPGASGRLKRLGTLVHETWHLVSNKPHAPACAGKGAYDGSRMRRAFGYLDHETLGECDAAGGAYHLEGLVGLSLAKYLPKGSAEETVKAYHYLVDRMGHVSLGMPNGGRVPDEIAREMFPSDPGRTMDHLPPRALLDIVDAHMRALRDAVKAEKPGLAEPCPNCDPVWGRTARVRKALDAMDARGLMPKGWSRPEPGRPIPDLDTKGAAQWVKAAQAAGGSAYNVPLSFVIPCEQLSRKCTVH